LSDYVCTDKDRKADCTNVKQEKVCGIFDKTVQCIEAPCGINGNSTCELCTQSNIERVVFSTCEEYGNNTQSTPTPPDSGTTKANTGTTTSPTGVGSTGSTEPAVKREVCSDEEKKQTKEYCSQIVTIADDTTCGWYDSTAIKCAYPCANEYSNRCYACIDPNVSYIIRGKCPRNEPTIPVDNSNCTDKERTDTTCDETLDAPVCGFTECSQDRCDSTFKNRCTACKKKDVVYVTKGECLPVLTKRECEAKERNVQACTLEYKGVCAIRDNNKCDKLKQDDCYFSTGNECQACSDPTVVTVINKECYQVFQPEIATTGIVYDDVAVNTRPPVTDRKLCNEKDRGLPCTKEYRGVCAYKADNCTSNCEITEATFCTACNNKEISYVVDGVCPIYAKPVAMKTALSVDAGAQETTSAQSTAVQIDESLDVYATRCSESERNEQCTEENKPVCAYETCTSGLCPKQMGNKCKACSDNKVIYTVNMDCKFIQINKLVLPCSDGERQINCSTSTSITFKNKVCGQYKGNSQFCLKDGSCSADFNTSCDACTVADIESYKPVTCENPNSSFLLSVGYSMTTFLIGMLIMM
jgi:hypothetical protein